MTRLEQALQELRRKGITLNSLKQLSGGINSAVFEAKDSNEVRYALKLYPLPTKIDTRNRCLTEKNFLSYLQSCKMSKTPQLLESNISAGWSLLSWLEGHKLTSLEPDDLREIASFIGAINQTSSAIARSQLQPASEACESLPGLIASIAERIKRLLSTNSGSEVSIDAVNWIRSAVTPRFQSASKQLLENRANSAHWQNLDSCRIASPSDVGIHNTLQTQKGLNFIDFEYAGMDDLSKLAADWIMQPEYCMDQQQENIFTNLLLAQTNEQIGDSWVSRLKDIKPLIQIKWCLIMLRQLQNNDLKKIQLEKAIAYFSAPEN